LLLEHGNPVFGVEPNADMRRAGEELLQSYPRFTSVNGTAEATALPDASVNFVTAAQAGHWFDAAESRKEFVRILKPQGWLVLLWNERKIDSTPFLRDYEQLLLKYGTDYEEVRHEHTVVSGFFDPHPFQERTFDLVQKFDYSGVEGRLLSSSYAPAQGHPNHDPMLRELRGIFGRHQQDGRIVFEYVTRLYYGQLA
jgi:SAM-dependent methyltransferase